MLQNGRKSTEQYKNAFKIMALRLKISFRRMIFHKKNKTCHIFLGRRFYIARILEKHNN